jgi:hypothetical protein
MTTLAVRRARPFWLVSATAVAAWILAWLALAPAVEWLTDDILGVDTVLRHRRRHRAGDAQPFGHPRPVIGIALGEEPDHPLLNVALALP